MAGSNLVICVLALIRLHLVLSDLYECPQFDSIFNRANPFQFAYMTTEGDELLSSTVNFTICFWMIPVGVNEEWTTFSYESFPSKKYDNEITVGFDNMNQKTKLLVGGKATLLPMPEMANDQWRHVCVLYDGSNPKVTFVYDGDEKFEEPGNASLRDYEIPGKGTVVLGQKHQVIFDSFEIGRGVKGALSRLQMWNRLLNDAEVKEQIQCNAPEGNLISWTKTPWQFHRNHNLLMYCTPTMLGVSACTGEESSDDENEEKNDEGRDMFNKKFGRNSIPEFHDVPVIPEHDDIVVIPEHDDVLVIPEHGDVPVIPEHDDVLVILEQRVAAPDPLEEYPQNPAKKKTNTRQQTNDVEALKEPTPINYKETKSKFMLFQRIVKTETVMLMEYAGQQPPRKGQMKASEVCPTEFTKIAGNCYYFSTETEDWNGAVKKCQTMDPKSSLLRLETREEWNELKQFIKNSEVLSSEYWWMDGTDQDREGHWTWGRTGQPFTFDDWCKSQPDNAGGIENCAHIRKLDESMCWNDLPCTPSKGRNFICEVLSLNFGSAN